MLVEAHNYKENQFWNSTGQDSVKKTSAWNVVKSAEKRAQNAPAAAVQYALELLQNFKQSLTNLSFLTLEKLASLPIVNYQITLLGAKDKKIYELESQIKLRDPHFVAKTLVDMTAFL